MDEPAYDGLTGGALAARLGLAACEVHAQCASTMDLAHAAAGRGAPAGTLILANEQIAGRGRGGRRWTSAPGDGVWMTLIERPRTPAGFDVLSLRVGLALAAALDDVAGTRIQLKWPNDLYVRGGKLAGILIEARWRDRSVEWVAIGVGLNVVPARDVPDAQGLADGVTRLAALDCAVPAVRAAAAREGPLDADELARFAARDLAVGRRAVQPADGVVAGVDAEGELLVDTPSGRVACRSGSLVFVEDR